MNPSIKSTSFNSSTNLFILDFGLFVIKQWGSMTIYSQSRENDQTSNENLNPFLLCVIIPCLVLTKYVVAGGSSAWTLNRLLLILLIFQRRVRLKSFYLRIITYNGTFSICSCTNKIFGLVGSRELLDSISRINVNISGSGNR